MSQIESERAAELAGLQELGVWSPDGVPPAFLTPDVLQIVPRVREPVHVVRGMLHGRIGIAVGGQVRSGGVAPGSCALLATLPPLFPEWLGDRSFLEAHRVRFPYIAGEMANGIATPAMVVSMARAGMLGFFGAAGLPLPRVEQGLHAIEVELGGTDLVWGANLIHSLGMAEAEDAVVSTYLRRGVRRVSASAFMSLTPAVVRYACTGLRLDPSGRIQRANHVFAKLSSLEVARQFMSPAPTELVDALVRDGKLTRDEARLAAHVAVAEDTTVEADSGGHTDNRPLAPLFSSVLQLAQVVMSSRRLARPIRVGAAGGLGVPATVAAAFALGAAYVLTGSINQSTVESGLSTDGKEMLAQAGMADTVMAPAADMFELGVQVQVLKRGTMFGVRARQLYDAYRSYNSLEAIPPALLSRLEREIFRAPVDEIWDQTRRYFEGRDPAEIQKAERDPKHRMALVFRWYLGQSSRWAINGTTDRRVDYQIWCGPAMGAFNAWVQGSFLAEPSNRLVVQVARNLLEGAAVITRAQQLRSYGVAVPAAAFQYRPRMLE
jgi:trans-AT polyketide synthase/acyltransferase/oxidoreductase domain-containing protein